jgi:hypothetical protein
MLSRASELPIKVRVTPLPSEDFFSPHELDQLCEISFNIHDSSKLTQATGLLSIPALRELHAQSTEIILRQKQIIRIVERRLGELED